MLKIVLLCAIIVAISTAPTPGYHHQVIIPFQTFPEVRVDCHPPIIETPHIVPIVPIVPVVPVGPIGPIIQLI